MSTSTILRGSAALATLALVATGVGIGTAAATASAVSTTENVPAQAAPIAEAQAAPAAAALPARASRGMSAAAVVAARQHAYTVFTTTSPQTRDMRGVERSLYRGTFYRASTETRRLCIVERESEGHYDVVNPSGAYRGAYQVSAALARGATWMMLKEHSRLMGKAAAKKVLGQLRSKPMNTWPRYWQDAAFHTVANWAGTGSGLRHWAGGRWHC